MHSDRAHARTRTRVCVDPRRRAINRIRSEKARAGCSSSREGMTRENEKESETASDPAPRKLGRHRTREEVMCFSARSPDFGSESHARSLVRGKRSNRETFSPKFMCDRRTAYLRGSLNLRFRVHFHF